ncbi:MAG TPA: cytochrome c [Vicinamibacterales bacterium]|jgi:mono/diheme cytochrome c family protein|nr:cytochrome c [Vicinamibacterales bacterium]
MTTRIWQFVVSVAVACSGVACSPQLDFERMRQQSRADAYSAGDVPTMRVPPAGTVPIATTDSSLSSGEHGRLQYDVFCAVCHGPDGSGQSVMAGNMPDMAPPSLTAPDARGRSDDELLDIVSHGKRRMPGYDWALTDVERGAVVAYVRRLQQTTPAQQEAQTR